MNLPAESGIGQTSDPDGNELSLFWTLGDGTFGSGDHQTKSWKTPGQNVVSCEASDGVGGLVTRQLLVVVGHPTTLLIQGRLIYEDGAPVAGVLVNNGKIDSESGIMLPGFVSAKTDSDGAFILSNFNPDDYRVSTSVYGCNVQRTDAFEPVHLDSTNVAGIQFITAPLPRVAVEFERSSINEGETTQIVFTRSGSTKEPLPLEFLVSGSAGMGQDSNSVRTNLIDFSPVGIPIPPWSDGQRYYRGRRVLP
ncbi:MAG: hypothetical protein JWM99_1016 [Verrucomicrobiales bacterium]|nr:hypothetical protein [Verrucomicrobiales bacterium]